MITKPKIEIDPEKVRALAAEGKNQEQIARALGICDDTLIARKKESREIREALKKGQEEAGDNIENVLYSMASSGENTAATIFWLKCRRPDRWSDRQKLDLTSSAPVQIQIINDLKE